MIRYLFPLILVGGGVALALSSAKANEKKKRVDKALDLGLDDVPVDDENPPLPPAMRRAYSENPVNRETFNEWWYSTEYPGNGVMGFWLDIDLPSAGLDWLLPGVGDEADSVVVTNDGAFWFFENGWHPAERMAQEYDEWFNAGV